MGSAELAAKNKLLNNHKLNLPDMIPNPIVIKVNDTIGIIVCKKNNQYVIDYCSDDRILSREYELIAK